MTFMSNCSSHHHFPNKLPLHSQFAKSCGSKRSILSPLPAKSSLLAVFSVRMHEIDEAHPHIKIHNAYWGQERQGVH